MNAYKDGASGHMIPVYRLDRIQDKKTTSKTRIYFHFMFISAPASILLSGSDAQATMEYHMMLVFSKSYVLLSHVTPCYST